MAALMMIFSVQASARSRWGFTAGMGFNTSQFSGVEVEARKGWNAGLTANFDLPTGFSLQPSLIYHQKGANITDNVSQSMGYLELPVSVQWGPDLLLFRPFLDVTPYVGYALTSRFRADVSGLVSIDEDGWDGKQRLEYGLGLGAGLDVWKLQLIARYNWNFGSMYDVTSWNDIKDTLKNEGISVDNPNFGGVTISLSYFF